MIFRIHVEKKEPHNVEAKILLEEIKNNLEINWLKNSRIIERYDVEGISAEIFEKAKHTVFAEPAVENIYDFLPVSDKNNVIFAVEFLPGQYDQKADACSQCLQIMTAGIRPAVRCAKIYILEPDGITPDITGDIEKIKNYIINKVESREAPLEEYKTLNQEYDIPWTVETIENFIDFSKEDLKIFLKSYALAMDIDDILFCQDYFKNSEKRNPTVTEIRMLDAYWSDHCRHTTFLTEITDVEIADDIVKDAFTEYLDLRGEIYQHNQYNQNNQNAQNDSNDSNDSTSKTVKKSVTLMDIATIGAKYLKKQGKLDLLDESEEVNACSVNIKVEVDGIDEDYLLMFKNETHNHPTEIEPFGGAATALGGTIRDVISGRSYSYQGMRVTGAADPRQKIADTMKNKLPQYKITRSAADGFSSYTNQIGGATGGVYEIYHPDYAAKRMELGAIVGAVPKSNVKRLIPISGDAIILLGGRTGRDGIGAAVGSSKSHTSESLHKSGAEVQKGNAIEERKIQRLFRNPKVAAMIKRCNDFGAGGVSVAIGELADSIFIDLSLVPAKYDGLDGTELAISESQERMAVVVAAENADEFIREANLENLEASKVAVVTDDNRLRMMWNGNQILSIERSFLNSNGAKKQAKIEIPAKNPEYISEILSIMYNKVKYDDIKQAYINLLSDLNICSQKGLIEQFDSSSGAGTVISPLGGMHRLTPSQFMAAKIPVLNGQTNTSSVMAYGFSPYISKISPYRGALYAVVESVSKLIAAGVNLSDIYLTFQEYFPGTQNDPKKFGLPFEALLGALNAQINLEVASIGGKDSMSGSYSYEEINEITGEKTNINIDVPPTLVSFAVGTADADKIISNEFKKSSSYVYLLKPYYKEDSTVDFEDLKNLYSYVNKLIEENMILSSYAIGFGGIGEAVFKMCIGNSIGFTFDNNITQRELFSSYYGAFIVESPSFLPNGELIGRTIAMPNIYINNITLELNDLIHKWILPLEKVFTTELNRIKDDITTYVPKIEYYSRPQIIRNYNNYQNSQNYEINQNNQSSPNYEFESFAKPRVLIPVFPGITCEYETAKQINIAGGLSDVFVFRNMTPHLITESIDIFAQKIYNSQILILAGGYSGSDSIGSGKFIAAVFRHPRITEAVRHLLYVKNGLILGIGAGFQALVKLGLLPYGDIKESMSERDPVISVNRIGRHQAYMTYTRIASVNSPWMTNVKVGDVHAVAVSHGEGRFCVNEEYLNILIQNGQISTQYCDINGNPTMHPYYNPNASDCAIEGIFNPDGRIFGKMGHSERIGSHIMKNIPGNKEQFIFVSGVRYFK